MSVGAPPTVDGPLFRTHEPPADGLTRVYLFRPGFSRVSSGDTPAVIVNGIEIANLLYESYLPLAFKPGTHRLSLKPTLTDSAVWKVDYDFSVDPGRTYYLAVWNTVDASGGTRVFVPILPIPGANLLLVQEGRIGGNTGVSVEFVSEKEALPALREMRLVQPKRDTF